MRGGQGAFGGEGAGEGLTGLRDVPRQPANVSGSGAQKGDRPFGLEFIDR